MQAMLAQGMRNDEPVDIDYEQPQSCYPELLPSVVASDTIQLPCIPDGCTPLWTRNLRLPNGYLSPDGAVYMFGELEANHMRRLYREMQERDVERMVNVYDDKFGGKVIEYRMGIRTSLL